MQDTFDYIKQFGGISFEDMPFNEVDNLNLCQAFYMPFEKVSPSTIDAEPKAFDEVCRNLYSFNGNKHVGPGLVLNKKISIKMMQMANAKRYAQMKIAYVHDVFKERPAVQFCGATFLLPGGTIVVVFRGTDDTIVGWKEDVDIYSKHGIPSHQLSVDYLEAVCEKYPEGDLIVCGHSKGGNVALYAGLASKKAIRDRIVCLYNNEGPGFDNYAWYSTPAYKELLPKYRHFVPTSSFIGMMLAHDNDYEIIKNKAFIGPMQHDITFWRTKGDTLERAKKLSIAGKFSDKFLNRFVFGIDDSNLGMFDKIMDTVMLDGIAAAAHGLLDVPHNLKTIVKGVKESYQSIDEEEKAFFKGYMSQAGSWIKGAAADTADELAKQRQEERKAKEADSAEPVSLSEKLGAKAKDIGAAIGQKLDGALEGAAQKLAEDAPAAPAEA